MNEQLSLSPRGAALVKAFENCLAPAGRGKFKAYLCPAGVLTIGWGHTNHHGRRFDGTSVWTQAQCDQAFAEDMAGFEAAVRRLVKRPLEQHQFDALVSFTYNCGEGNLAKSTLLRKLNRGDFAGAAREFAKWNKGGGKVLRGLVRRRASEALLFQGLADADHDGKADAAPAPAVIAEAMPQQVDAPAPDKPLLKSKMVQTAGAAGAGGAGLAIDAASEAAKNMPADVAGPSSQIDAVRDALGQAGELGRTAKDAGLLDALKPSPSLLDAALHTVLQPKFLLGLAIVAACAAIAYWRWRDHQ